MSLIYLFTCPEPVFVTFRAIPSPLPIGIWTLGGTDFWRIGYCIIATPTHCRFVLVIRYTACPIVISSNLGDDEHQNSHRKHNVHLHHRSLEEMQLLLSLSLLL